MKLPPEQLVEHSAMDDTNNWVYGVMNYVSQSTKLISSCRDVAGSEGELQGAEFVPTTVKIHNGQWTTARQVSTQTRL